MKKFIYLLAGLALSAGFTACEDDKEPSYHNPDPQSFTLNTPAFQNQLLETTGDQDDKTTFNLFCSQPDYGFSAVCEYGVQVSLTDQFVDGTDAQEPNYYTLSNQNPSQAAMAFRTYDLAVAMTELLGIHNLDEFNAYDGPDVMPLYFRATCRIPGVKGSEVVSNNVVRIDQVTFSYAIPTAGIIYITGHVTNAANGTEQSFEEPSEANKAKMDNFQLVEPVIACKLYAGTYIMKKCSGGIDNVDNCAQFRFFTELKGWSDVSVQLGSHEGDFYVENITDGFTDGLFTGSGVMGAQGNWGIYSEAEKPEDRTYTLVVGLQDKANPKVWFKQGRWDVEVVLDANNNNEPKFVEPASAE